MQLGTAVHALAALQVVPVDGEHIRDTMARHVGVKLQKRASKPPRGRKIGFARSSRTNYKSWQRWNELQQALMERGYTVESAPEDVSIDRLAGWLCGLDLLVAVDSGTLHLADSMTLRVVGLYGATSSVTFGPYNDARYCVDKHDGPTNKHSPGGMSRIAVQDVLEMIERAYA